MWRTVCRDFGSRPSLLLGVYLNDRFCGGGNRAHEHWQSRNAGSGFSNMPRCEASRHGRRVSNPRDARASPSRGIIGAVVLLPVSFSGSGQPRHASTEPLQSRLTLYVGCMSIRVVGTAIVRLLSSLWHYRWQRN